MLSFLTILCCLAGSTAPVQAAGTEVPRVTFTNEPKNLPDLYVTKLVEGETGDGQLHDQFQFVLTLNGEPANKVKYRLFQLDEVLGKKEIAKMRVIEGDATRKTEVDFTTDENGVFTLEAGQQAFFESIGTGVHYEVSELDVYLEAKRNDENEILYKDSEYHFYEKEVTVETEIGADGTEIENQKVTYGADLYGEVQTRQMSLKKGGYRKVSPSGGTTGERIMPFNGASVEFVNAYGTNGDMVISKTVAFPAYWKVPETEEFLFQILIDEEPYKAEEFTAANTVTGEQYTGRTSAEGCFVLRGGWTATFENVPDHMDYRIRELQEVTAGVSLGTALAADGQTEKDVFWPGGWWAAGATEQYGSTPPGTQIDFINSRFSFVVTKRLEDNSKPDVNFNFRLTDAQNNGMGNQTYFLYKSSGSPVDINDLPEADRAKYTYAVIADSSAEGGTRKLQTNETQPRNILQGTTGADGSFTLKAGQAAVFTSVRPGTSYKVVETGTAGYTQVLPETTETYSVDSSGSVRILDFTNKGVERGTGTMTVLKTVENVGGEGALEKETFHFLLYRSLETVDEFMDVFEAEVTAEDRKQALDTEDGDGTEGEGEQQNKLPDWWSKLSAKWKAVLRTLEFDKNEMSGKTEEEGAKAIKEFLDTKVTEKLSALTRDSRDYVKIPVTGENAGQDLKTIGDLNNYRYTDGSSSYELFLPVENEMYTMPGTKDLTYRTGPNTRDGVEYRPGEFTLKDSEIAQFNSLKAGSRYLVREIDILPEYSELTPGYVKPEGEPERPADPHYREIDIVTQQPEAVYDVESGDSDDVIVVIPPAKPTPKYYGQVTELSETGADLTFTNIYKAEKVDLVLNKISKETPVEYLPGAQFMLFLKEGREQADKYLPTELPDGITAEKFCYETNADGTVTISDLKLGTYWLYETKAPSGYCLLNGPVKIQIIRTRPGTGGQEEAGQLQVFINDKLYAADIDSDVTLDDLRHIKVTDKTSETGSKAKIELTVINAERYELPSSGGSGIYWYSIGGMLLMMAAALILYRYKLRGEVLRD